MILRDVSTEVFKNEIIEKNYKIVVYGYGVIGKITAPQYLDDLGLKNNFLFFVDADKHKQGRFNNFCLGEICVYAPETMFEIRDRFVVLVTGSRCSGIIYYLESQDDLKNVKVFILPMMLEQDSLSKHPVEIQKVSDTPLIPKIIHYCWFGGNPLPDFMQKCIETWKEYCPDYEIIRWDENNYDVKRHKYVRQAYELRKWAFVTDVARLDILYENGGIYLDTDVELIRNLDNLLYQPGFCGVEKWRILNTGGGCGAVSGNSMIGKMLDYRKEVAFLREDGSINTESSGTYESLPCIYEGFRPNNTMQVIDDLIIYPSEVFHPYDYLTEKCAISKNTFSIHHFAGSWVD